MPNLEFSKKIIVIQMIQLKKCNICFYFCIRTNFLKNIQIIFNAIFKYI